MSSRATRGCNESVWTPTECRPACRNCIRLYVSLPNRVRQTSVNSCVVNHVALFLGPSYTPTVPSSLDVVHVAECLGLKMCQKCKRASCEMLCVFEVRSSADVTSRISGYFKFSFYGMQWSHCDAASIYVNYNATHITCNPYRLCLYTMSKSFVQLRQ